MLIFPSSLQRTLALASPLVVACSALLLPSALGATTPTTTTVLSMVTTTTFPASATLRPGQSLTLGQELLNPGGIAFAQVTMKGDFILHNGATVTWHTKTSNKGVASITMQNDGNLVMRNAKGTALWNSHTSGGGNFLELDPLGNLDILSSGNLVLWSNGKSTTNTVSDLGPGQELRAGQYLVSLDGTQQAALSATGALFDAPLAQQGSVGWVTPVDGGDNLYMNPDGNLELRDASNNVLWSTLTAKYPGTQLQILNSGVLQLVTPKNVSVWHVSQSAAPVLSTALGAKVVSIAESFDQYSKHPVVETPRGSECNPFTKALGWGATSYRVGAKMVACPSGTRSESWCADFGTWLWRHAGAVSTGLTAWSYSFVRYGLDHNTLKLGSMNHPQVGDAIVYGAYNTKNPYAGYGAHVGFVAAVKGRQIEMVSGNWNEAVVLTGFFTPSSVNNGSGYPIIGYISPVKNTQTTTTTTTTTSTTTTTVPVTTTTLHSASRMTTSR